jgi:hypothetical protein
MLTRSSIFAAMLFAVAFVFAPGLARGATQSLDLQFTGVTDSIVDPYVVLFSSTPGVETFEGYGLLQTIPTGSSSQALILSPAASSQTTPATIQTNTPIDGFVLIGVYPPTGTQGISLGVSPTGAAAIEGESYTELTAPLSPTFPSEATVVASLESPSPAVITGVLGAFGTPIAAMDAIALINPNDGSGDLVDFSDGTLNGSVSSTLATTGSPAVPLPSAAWMALIMVGALATVSMFRAKLRPQIAA